MTARADVETVNPARRGRPALVDHVPAMLHHVPTDAVTTTCAMNFPRQPAVRWGRHVRPAIRTGRTTVHPRVCANAVRGRHAGPVNAAWKGLACATRNPVRRAAVLGINAACPACQPVERPVGSASNAIRIFPISAGRMEPAVVAGPRLAFWVSGAPMTGASANPVPVPTAVANRACAGFPRLARVEPLAGPVCHAAPMRMAAARMEPACVGLQPRVQPISTVLLAHAGRRLPPAHPQRRARPWIPRLPWPHHHRSLFP